MRVVITGSRTITDYEIVKFCLENSPFDLKNSILILGGCKGSRINGKWNPAPSVDKLAAYWADVHKIPYVEYPPEWYPNGIYDKRAALVRDEMMVEITSRQNGVLVGIWDGESTGTEYTIRMAEKYNLDYVYWMIQME